MHGCLFAVLFCCSSTYLFFRVLVVVVGDPLADLALLETAVLAVFRNGRQVALASAKL